ncbi:hypothetical protein SAMN04488120_103183 [Fontimonas thermophila]|uniref:DUF3108 domain-containing protein n=1 Tax=Fontimonas thermophila TaxID=1076937 RepID=A0A1I2IEM0_9GAMM|nr:hypothetical protein [Fontimonas thermophila]SFF39537.1 hypothetical protein SAMN04488120_103183 [Fontimonas thermophila]
MRPGLGTLLVLAMAVTPAQAARVETLVGYAYARASGEPIYEEHHRFVYDGAVLIEHRVDYRRPDGTPLATKTLDYRTSRYAPAFRLADARDGYVEGAEYVDGSYRLFRRSSQRAAEESKRLPASPDLVADAGFDQYLRDHLQNLLRMGKAEIRFAVAGRLDAFAFRAVVLERTRLFGSDAVKLRVEPDSWLRWLVKPIDLTYDLRDGRLLRYEGLSNIRSETGELYDARIDFPDPPVVRGDDAAAASP